MRVLELKLNNQRVEYSNPNDLGLRLDRIAQSRENLAVKGSDFSTTITLPKTKNNNRLFSNRDLLGQLNKFNAIQDFIAEILVDGERLIYGTFRLTKVTRAGYEGELKSDAGNWIELIDQLQLNELGVVDGVPTWFFPFTGAQTIDSANNALVGQSLYRFPTIVYNNTPLIDYFGVPAVDIFGLYDMSCEQLSSPKDFPNDFPLRNGYFGWRDGLTFEDFPPAINYGDLIKKCFEQIGWNCKGQIFDEEWFKALIMPHTGEDFKYNWKTLGELFAELQSFNEAAVSYPFMLEWQNYFRQELGGPPFPNEAEFANPNIGRYDDVTTRIDPVANFDKYLVTDDSTGTLTSGGYVAGATGRYRIRVSSKMFKELVPDGATGEAALDAFGGGNPDYGWDDNVLVITRRDQSGDYVFDDDYRNKLALWMGQSDTAFIDAPNDVIAYFSAKRYGTLGVDIEALGSPLSNWVEQVQVNAFSHSILSNTILLKSSESVADIEIEIDLEKNERVNFYWFAYVNQFDNNGTAVDNGNYEISNSISQEIEVQYLCGYDDIDVASNLPATGVKEFIGSFINQFNLRFNVVDASKTVEFIMPNTYFSNPNNAYDITSRVDDDSIAINPPNAPKTLIIGYNNDNGDRLLTSDASACDFTNTTELSDYANLVIRPNDNIYGDGELEIKSIFSATRFVPGTFDLMDIGSGGTTIGSASNAYPDCNGYPITIQAYWRYNGGTTLNYDLPSIQSRSSFDQEIVGELEYSYAYTPRIMYFLGTANQVFGTNADYKIKIGSAAPGYATQDIPKFSIEPTVCAFDTENNNPYPSLRYDTYLYDQFFDNLVEYYNQSYILDADVAMRASDWRSLQANILVRHQGILYRLLQINDFDPLEDNLASIVLMKVV